MLFANATLKPGIFLEASRERETPRLLNPLNQMLERQPFSLSEFSVADVAVGSILAYIPMMLKLVDLSAYPAILNYIKRLSERPAFPKSIGDVVEQKGLGSRLQGSRKKELHALWIP